ncbi:MAG: zinc-ribbon domain-containing protein [Promethearchaeota archaeon]
MEAGGQHPTFQSVSVSNVKGPSTIKRKYCMSCGKEIDADAVICPFCGKDV